VKVGGVVGAILGFAISVVFTEVIFVNNQEWTSAVNVVLTVAGAFACSLLVRRFATRNANPS
jgi:hypothetical protein